MGTVLKLISTNLTCWDDSIWRGPIAMPYSTVHLEKTPPDRSIVHAQLKSLQELHRKLCVSLFNDIVKDKDHKLHTLLPPKNNNSQFFMRRPRTFSIPNYKTNRTKNTFLMASSINYDSSF